RRCPGTRAIPTIPHTSGCGHGLSTKRPVYESYAVKIVLTQQKELQNAVCDAGASAGPHDSATPTGASRPAPVLHDQLMHERRNTCYILVAGLGGESIARPRSAFRQTCGRPARHPPTTGRPHPSNSIVGRFGWRNTVLSPGQPTSLARRPARLLRPASRGDQADGTTVTISPHVLSRPSLPLFATRQQHPGERDGRVDGHPG